MLGKLKHKQPISGMHSCCKQHSCSLSTMYEDTQQLRAINGTARFHGGRCSNDSCFLGFNIRQ
jgi:hypothetical protein